MRQWKIQNGNALSRTDFVGRWINRKSHISTATDGSVRQEKLLTGRSGQLAGHLWIGDQQPQRSVLVVHGLGDHSGRFEPLARALVPRGVAVFSFDLPGHGDSPGERGSAESFDALLEEIDAARKTLSDRLPSINPVLFGHSMGGNLVLNYVLRQSMRRDENLPSGMVLCAPMLLPPTPPPRPHIFAAWLTGHVFPWIRIDRPVDTSALTGDPVEAERIANDPLRHSKITIYLATQLLSQGRWALDHARELNIPTLILFGEQDPLIDRSACKHLAIRMGDHATLAPCSDMRHDLLHDNETENVLKTIQRWIHEAVEFSLNWST